MLRVLFLVDKLVPAGTQMNLLRVVLSLLKDLEVIRRKRDGRLVLAKATLSGGNLDAIAATYATRADADREKLERMMSYGQSARCRWSLLLEYFGEDEPDRMCGVCDNCLNPPELALGA